MGIIDNPAAWLVLAMIIVVGVYMVFKWAETEFERDQDEIGSYWARQGVAYEKKSFASAGRASTSYSINFHR